MNLTLNISDTGDVAILIDGAPIGLIEEISVFTDMYSRLPRISVRMVDVKKLKIDPSMCRGLEAKLVEYCAVLRSHPFIDLIGPSGTMPSARLPTRTEESR